MENWRADLGPLSVLLTDSLRDLCVDGDGRAWVDDGRGFRDTTVTLTPGEVRHIGAALIESGGGRVDDARPIGDAALGGVLRAHLALPPIARTGPLLSIRFPSRSRLGLDAFTSASGDDLSRLARETSLIAGVTGSGKTTLAAAVIDSLPREARVVIVEDLAELNPGHSHSIHLTARAANADGGGAIRVGQLVSETLRMRPDSLVLGEIRGEEIRDFLAVTSAGHHGISTIHAGNLDAVADRVTTLALLAGIPFAAIAPLVAETVSSVAFCSRVGDSVNVSLGRFVCDGPRLRVVRG